MGGTVACSPSRANNRVTDREADDGDGEEEEEEEKARRKGGGSYSAHGSQQSRSIYRLVMVLAVYACVSAHVYTTLANSPPTPTRALTKLSAPLPGYPQIPCCRAQCLAAATVSQRVVIVGVFAPPAGTDLNLHRLC